MYTKRVIILKYYADLNRQKALHAEKFQWPNDEKIFSLVFTLLGVTIKAVPHANTSIPSNRCLP
jgi:hypothetical protein